MVYKIVVTPDAIKNIDDGKHNNQKTTKMNKILQNLLLLLIFLSLTSCATIFTKKTFELELKSYSEY